MALTDHPSTTRKSWQRQQRRVFASQPGHGPSQHQAVQFPHLQKQEERRIVRTHAPGSNSARLK